MSDLFEPSRRQVLAGLAAAPLALGGGRNPWDSLRVVTGDTPVLVERAAASDAAALLGRALGRKVEVAPLGRRWGKADLFVACPDSTGSVQALAPAKAGAYRLLAPGSGPAIQVVGHGPEGARNGLHALLRRWGFGFFRDGTVVPHLGPASFPPAGSLDEVHEPTFALRGDMIWDNYQGPRRLCPATWTWADWEQALLFAARTGLNFIQFYPPMAAFGALAFPDIAGFPGRVRTAEAELSLAKQVVSYGRALGLKFLYSVTYGGFPEEVRAAHPDLGWANGHLCPDRPELARWHAAMWTALVDELGTDGLWAIHHRGESGQAYSNPCSTASKAAGYAQALGVLDSVDPGAQPFVWTWAEELPGIFAELPEGVRAMHIRHGMGGVFADRGAGREQQPGKPDVGARRWIEGQFTVFGGNESWPRSAWGHDPETLVGQARAAAADPTCDGFFAWPEWAAASPWTADLLARLAWDPQRVGAAQALTEYGHRRHGDRITLFQAAWEPLVDAGDARFMETPLARRIVPWFASPPALRALKLARSGLRQATAGLPKEPLPLLERDLADALLWVGRRQAQVLEAQAWIAAVGERPEEARAFSEAALRSWGQVLSVLQAIPELSLVRSLAVLAGGGGLSERAVDVFLTQSVGFYGGYPLAMSPEAVEFVCLPQSRRLADHIAALTPGGPALLPDPGWFWHDFPAIEGGDWADAVRKLPGSDDGVERALRGLLEDAVANPVRAGSAEPTPIDHGLLRRAASELNRADLGAPLDAVPAVGRASKRRKRRRR